MVVVEANALSSPAIDDIAAENMTASNNPMTPCGKLLSTKFKTRKKPIKTNKAQTKILNQPK